mgnify:FL=1
MKEDFQDQKPTNSVLKANQNEGTSIIEKVNIYLLKDPESGESYDLRDPIQYQQMLETCSETQPLKGIQYQEFWYFFFICMN